MEKELKKWCPIGQANVYDTSSETQEDINND